MLGWGEDPKNLGLARAKSLQITTETKEAAKTCRIIADKHIIYSGYAGGKPQTTSRQERRKIGQRERGKSTRRDESKSVYHRGCCSSPDPPLVLPAREISSLQILQGGVQKLAE